MDLDFVLWYCINVSLNDLFWMFYITHAHTHLSIYPYIPTSPHTHTYITFDVKHYVTSNESLLSCQWVTCLLNAFRVCVFVSWSTQSALNHCDTSARVAAHVCLVLAVMVCGRIQNKWSISPSAFSWIQSFTNGLSQCNLSKWTAIIIPDLNAWALLSRYLFKHTK